MMFHVSCTLSVGLKAIKEECTRILGDNDAARLFFVKKLKRVRRK
jgi:hypothetical protein